jgi:hypothetical protein
VRRARRKLLEARRERAQPIDLLALERQVSPQEVVVSSRQRRDAQVGDSVREMVERVRDLAALELGEEGQRDEPRLRRVAERADRGARVAEEEPRPLLVVAEHLRDAIGMAREELGREPRLECLHPRARLEPGHAAGERHAQDGRPGPLVLRFDPADRLDVIADPRVGANEVHASTMR